jgi:hypothetical protein
LEDIIPMKFALGIALGMVWLILLRLIADWIHPTRAEIRRMLLEGKIDEDYALELLKRAKR